MATGSVRFDPTKARSFLAAHELENQAAAVRAAHQVLHDGTGPGREYLGWLAHPRTYDRAEFARIKAAAERIRNEADALVVIGIGGSYLGARATIEALGHSFHNLMPEGHRRGPEVYFAGKELSPVYLSHLLELLGDRRVVLNVISKSGTTTEPAIAFRVLRRFLEERHGKDEARRRIYATTDRARGALKQLADAEGYESFVVPDDIGGRYSVLTAVGLLPIAASGADVDGLMAGAAEAVESYGHPDLDRNQAYQYAAARHALYRKGRMVEVLAHYEPALRSTAEWWKQLFGESEGKDQKGILPASLEFSTDLHSMGQYVQDGLRILFETVLHVERPRVDLTLTAEPEDLDGLNFLSGTTLGEVNRKAMEGTLLAHTDGGVPNLLVSVPELTEYHYGQMIYFFEKACAISGYLLGVNPFDQPGVEAYKKNMFALLGKPGFESLRAELLRRLE